MRKLSLSVLFLSLVVGALYFFEVFDFGTDQTEMVVSQERHPVAAQVQKLMVDPVETSADTQVRVQESLAQPMSTTKVKLEQEKKQDQLKAPTQEKAPLVPAKSAKKAGDQAQAPEKKSEAQEDKKEEKAQNSLITLPIEDNFRVKEHKRPGTLGYKHWTGWYYPTKFILTINDIPVITFNGKEFTRPNKELTFDPSKPLKAHFVWEFLHGRKAGWRSTEFQLNPDAQSIFIGFDWKDQWQVIIDQAAPIAQSDKSSDNKNVDKR